MTYGRGARLLNEQCAAARARAFFSLFSFFFLRSEGPRSFGYVRVQGYQRDRQLGPGPDVLLPVVRKRNFVKRRGHWIQEGENQITFSFFLVPFW